jgi:hypothetical protein
LFGADGFYKGCVSTKIFTDMYRFLIFLSFSCALYGKNLSFSAYGGIYRADGEGFNFS